MIKQFYHCACYYTNNIYLKSYNMHFTYLNDEQFFKDYGDVLRMSECTATEIENIIHEINKEVKRRKSVHQNTKLRQELIKANYVPSDLSVYTLKEDFLESSFLKLVEASRSSDPQIVLQMVAKLSTEKKIYGFPVFKPEFCLKLLSELNHFEKSNLPKERPNTMNNNGVLIDDLGFHEPFSLPLREKYLDPISNMLFPEWRGQGLDSHKIFTVGYKFGQDTELGYHYDNSEVTLNVCLGKTFEGGSLCFGDMITTPVAESTCVLIEHKIGYGILHRGQQYHSALPIKSGERHNLILWMRSSSIRNSQCPMCLSKPVLMPSDDYGDGFTKPQEVALCGLL